MNIKKGDNVIIISGKDKGKKGKVTKAIPKENRVVVEGTNMRKKHEKAKKANQKGQVIELASPIHVSNVMIVDPKEGKRTRIGMKIDEKTKKRVTKKSGATV